MPEQIEREAQRQKERLLATEQLRAPDGPEDAELGKPALLAAAPARVRDPPWTLGRDRRCSDIATSHLTDGERGGRAVVLGGLRARRGGWRAGAFFEKAGRVLPKPLFEK